MNTKGMMNIFNSMNFMGLKKKNRRKETTSYSRMIQNNIAKRRAANKVARKARKASLSPKGPGRCKRRFLK